MFINNENIFLDISGHKNYYSYHLIYFIRYLTSFSYLNYFKKRLHLIINILEITYFIFLDNTNYNLDNTKKASIL